MHRAAQDVDVLDAEHSASDAALRYLTTLPGAPMIAVPPPEPPSPTPTPAPSAAGAASALATVEKFTNPKGTLQEIVLKKMRRQTPDDAGRCFWNGNRRGAKLFDDLCYQPTPVDNGYIIRLRVGAHVVGGEALTIDSRPFPIKTKKSVKESTALRPTAALRSNLIMGSQEVELFNMSVDEEAEEEVASMALQRLNVGSAVPAAPPKTLVEALTKPAEAPAAAAMSNQEVGFGASTHSSDGRADTEQDWKHRPSCLGEEEVEVVGPGDMVLLPEFTLLDCTMVFDTSEDLNNFCGLGCLPGHERNLRRLLAERLPVPDPPKTPSTTPRDPLTIDKVMELRQDQARRLEHLIPKVRPGKDPQAPLMRAAELRLKRLYEPLPLHEEEEKSEEKPEIEVPEAEEPPTEADMVCAEK
eukprot:s1316_g15.t1